MENPRKTNNNRKSSPLSINIGAGAGRLGIGGIVLFGGALVAATIASAVVFKTRSQRRPSSENSKKTMSPETSSPELQNSSDEDHEVTSMAIETTDTQSLTPVEMGNYGIGYEQEQSGNTSIYVDSAFESEEFDNNCEKIDLGCEEQVVMAVQIEENNGDDEHDDEHVDANSLDSEEGVKLIGDYEVIEVPIKDIVAEASENEDEDEEDEVHQETVPTMEVVEDQTTGKEDTPSSELLNQEQMDKESVQKLEEQVIIEDEDEGVDGDKDEIDVSEALENKDEEDESHQETVMMNEVSEAAAAMEVANDQTTAKVDTPPNQFMNQEQRDKESAQKLEEQAIIEDEDEDEDDIDVSEALENEDEEDESHQETVMMNEVSEEAAAMEVVDDQETGVQVKTEMITENEVFKKDEIPHDQSDKEDECNEEDVRLKSLEAKISDPKIEENMEENQTILSKKQNGKKEKQAIASEQWNLKLMTWAVVVSLWCLCHWYSEQPFLELSILVSLLFVLILLGPSNRTWSNVVKHAH